MKKKSTYKVTDLFGNENLKIIRHSPPKHNLFDDYDTWLESSALLHLRRVGLRALAVRRNCQQCFVSGVLLLFKNL